MPFASAFSRVLSSGRSSNPAAAGVTSTTNGNTNKSTSSLYTSPIKNISFISHSGSVQPDHGQDQKQKDQGEEDPEQPATPTTTTIKPMASSLSLKQQPQPQQRSKSPMPFSKLKSRSKAISNTPTPPSSRLSTNASSNAIENRGVSKAFSTFSLGSMVGSFRATRRGYQGSNAGLASFKPGSGATKGDKRDAYGGFLEEDEDEDEYEGEVRTPSGLGSPLSPEAFQTGISSKERRPSMCSFATSSESHSSLIEIRPPSGLGTIKLSTAANSTRNSLETLPTSVKSGDQLHATTPKTARELPKSTYPNFYLDVVFNNNNMGFDKAAPTQGQKSLALSLRADFTASNDFLSLAHSTGEDNLNVSPSNPNPDLTEILEPSSVSRLLSNAFPILAAYLSVEVLKSLTLVDRSVSTETRKVLWRKLALGVTIDFDASRNKSAQVGLTPSSAALMSSSEPPFNLVTALNLHCTFNPGVNSNDDLQSATATTEPQVRSSPRSRPPPLVLVPPLQHSKGAAGKRATIIIQAEDTPPPPHSGRGSPAPFSQICNDDGTKAGANAETTAEGRSTGISIARNMSMLSSRVKRRTSTLLLGLGFGRGSLAKGASKAGGVAAQNQDGRSATPSPVPSPVPSPRIVEQSGEETPAKASASVENAQHGETRDQAEIDWMLSPLSLSAPIPSGSHVRLPTPRTDTPATTSTPPKSAHISSNAVDTSLPVIISTSSTAQNPQTPQTSSLQHPSSTTASRHVVSATSTPHTSAVSFHLPARVVHQGSGSPWVPPPEWNQSSSFSATQRDSDETDDKVESNPAPRASKRISRHTAGFPSLQIQIPSVMGGVMGDVKGAIVQRVKFASGRRRSESIGGNGQLDVGLGEAEKALLKRRMSVSLPSLRARSSSSSRDTATDQTKRPVSPPSPTLSPKLSLPFLDSEISNITDSILNTTGGNHLLFLPPKAASTSIAVTLSATSPSDSSNSQSGQPSAGIYPTNVFQKQSQAQAQAPLSQTDSQLSGISALLLQPSPPQTPHTPYTPYSAISLSAFPLPPSTSSSDKERRKTSGLSSPLKSADVAYADERTGPQNVGGGVESNISPMDINMLVSGAFESAFARLENVEHVEMDIVLNLEMGGNVLQYLGRFNQILVPLLNSLHGLEKLSVVIVCPPSFDIGNAQSQLKSQWIELVKEQDGMKFLQIEVTEKVF